MKRVVLCILACAKISLFGVMLHIENETDIGFAMNIYTNQMEGCRTRSVDVPVYSGLQVDMGNCVVSRVYAEFNYQMLNQMFEYIGPLDRYPAYSVVFKQAPETGKLTMVVLPKNLNKKDL